MFRDRIQRLIISGNSGGPSGLHLPQISFENVTQEKSVAIATAAVRHGRVQQPNPNPNLNLFGWTIYVQLGRRRSFLFRKKKLEKK